MEPKEKADCVRAITAILFVISMIVILFTSHVFFEILGFGACVGISVSALTDEEDAGIFAKLMYPFLALLWLYSVASKLGLIKIAVIFS